MNHYRIRDLFVVTTVSAVIVAFARIAMAMFLALFLLAIFLLVTSSVVTIVFALVFAEQKGTSLDPQTIPGISILKRVWQISAIYVVLVWTGIFVSFMFI